MSRRVQNIDAEPLIFKLHDGGSDGDPSLFLQLHPVGNGMPGSGFALDGTRQLNGTSVKEKFFGQCGLTGVRMGDDGKCAPAFYFLSGIAHILPQI